METGLEEQAEKCVKAIHGKGNKSSSRSSLEQLESLLNIPIPEKATEESKSNETWSPLEAYQSQGSGNVCLGDNQQMSNDDEDVDLSEYSFENNDQFYGAVLEFCIALFDKYSSCVNGMGAFMKDDVENDILSYSSDFSFRPLYRGMNIIHNLQCYYQSTCDFSRVVNANNASAGNKLIRIVFQFYTNLPQLHTSLNNVQKLYRKKLIKANETDRTFAANKANLDAAQGNTKFQSFLNQLQYFLHGLYKYSNPCQRIRLRHYIGCYLQYMGTFLVNGANGSDTSGLGEMLHVIQFISVRKEVTLDLLRRLVLPLFYPNTLSSWRDQQCSLELYFEPLRNLVYDVVKRFDDDGRIASEIINVLCSPKVWPHTSMHTGKLVLILCIIQELLGALQALCMPKAFMTKFFQICRSEHSRVAEKALLFFKDENFTRLIKEFFENNPTSALSLLRALVRPTDKSWNPTVNKFTHLALHQCSKLISPLVFDRAIEDIFANANNATMKCSLSAVKKNHQKFGKSPSATVTGVAPWAMQNTQQYRKMPRTVSKTPHFLPKTVTRDNPQSAKAMYKSMYKSYLESLVPKAPIGNSKQSNPDMSEAKFHDFVFDSKPLGSGSFSTVKYAKYICRSGSRKDTIHSSEWPEYAIKVLNKDKLKEFNYWGNINREIAILSLLNGNNKINKRRSCNIVQLCTTFHLHGNVYLVMEYAPLGDLFNFIPIIDNIDAVRFVMKEVTNGLEAVHNLGFVFGDLKPENILVCPDEHLKLTDFGASRPITESSRKALDEMGNMLAKVRDGFWKQSTEDASLADISVNLWHDDEDRIEGTKAYLSPEIIKSNSKALTFSDDIWALGCVFFQTMTGRIPRNDNIDEPQKHTVSFNQLAETCMFGHVIKSTRAPTGMAYDLLSKMLEPDQYNRLNTSCVLSHSFMDGPCESLKSENSKIKAFSGCEDDNDAWARRQYSSIWAPLDPASAVKVGSLIDSPNRSSQVGGLLPKVEENFITENEDECGSFFGSTHKIDD